MLNATIFFYINVIKESKNKKMLFIEENADFLRFETSFMNQATRTSKKKN